VDTLTVDSGAGVEREIRAEDVFVSTYPNPFGSKVQLKYSVPGTYGSSVPVSLKIFDVRGREVTTLASGAASPGEKSAVWDGTYADGSRAPSGIYFLQLAAGRARVIEKVVLTR
jgi:flagellar hook assembly protein FlgD